jgi:hypothetical protein
MWFRNLFDYLAATPSRTPAGRTRRVASRRRPAATRLQLEALEDRCLLSFSPAASFPVGATSAASQQAVVSVDFNHDDKLDLATRNENGTVSVLMGDGLGGFGAANLFAVGSMDYSLAVADFNNDGNLDLATIGGGFAVTGSNLPQASVLLGNGDGTFQPPLYTSLPNGSPSLAAVGDFNADGNADFVCTGSFQDPDVSINMYPAVEVLLGNGGGGFTDTYEYRLQGDSTYGLAVADLNADDKPDVVTVDYYAGTVSVLMGLGDGLLSNESFFATGQTPHSVAVGDFTGDGIPDLVTGGLTVDVLPGLGDGTFAPPIHHATNGYASAVRTADFNGDGKLDVVTADPGAGTVSVFLGRGDGTLNSPIDNAAGTFPAAVAIGDFNGDGRSDVAAADRGSNMYPTTILSTVMVLLNDGDWSLPPQPPPPSIAISDVTVTEGNTGTANATFTLTLSFASTVAVLVHYDTADITAAAGSDYTAASGDVIIPAGQTSRTFTVAVKGDRLAEATETFAVNLSAPINGTISDGQGIGTIIDDEPRISISDVTKKEGNDKKTTLFTFTVTLSAAYDQAVTMSYSTVNGTATTGNNDYVAKTGTLTFAPGETTKTITIEVKGDRNKEANETFYLDLFDCSSNSLFTKNRGIGTILNDD